MLVQLTFTRDNFDRILECRVLNTHTREYVCVGDVVTVRKFLKERNFKYVTGTNGLWLQD